MLRFEGDREFSRTPAELFARLTDVPFLVSCIPDVETIRAQEADRAELVIRPGFAFVRGSLEATLRLLEGTGTSARLLLGSKGIGSSSEVEANLTFAAIATGTRVHWTMEVKSLGGLLKMVPHGLIRGAAEKVINEAWVRIEEKLKV